MTELKRALLECILVGLVGAGLGLGANALNPQGLKLSEDYFEKRKPPGTTDTQPSVFTGSRPTNNGQLANNGQPSNNGQPTNPDSSPEANGEGHNGNGQDASPLQDPLEDSRIRYVVEELGFQAITHAAAAELFRDPYYADGVYIFIDARSEDFYTDGHVPGAYNLDHFNREPTIDAVLQACQGAEKIIVYCNGGRCEDSGYTSQDLEKQGVDFNKLFIYAGGFEEWVKQNMPVEKGPRKPPRWSHGQ